MEIQKKPTKTISGVAPLAVMLPPRKCPHGTCLYCPSLNAPQSYTPESPAVLRACQLEYDAKKQVKSRIETFKAMKHPTDKIELIIMGGTFLGFPKEFQFNFIKECYDALNGKKSRTLEQAKNLNEKSNHKCVALCIETRPDVCSDEEINDMLKMGATRVELGVQCIDDDIYNIVKRGHNVEDVKTAVKRLRKAGFKIGFHLMPGLPGSNMKKDIKMFKRIFSSQDFRPDQIKIYPCQVLKGAELEKQYFNGNYVPYSKEQTKEIIVKMLKLTPEYCRVMRIMREIPPSFLTAGVINIDLRKDIEEIIRKKGIKIREIRFREIGFALRDFREVKSGIKIKIKKYHASEGKEFFLQAINNDNILFGLLRLRLERNKDSPAIVRELHVYGPSVEIGKIEDGKYQHKGLGRMLLKSAEEISKKYSRKKIKVISGVGAREYYRKFGYSLDKQLIYMEKDLN